MFLPGSTITDSGAKYGRKPVSSFPQSVVIFQLNDKATLGLECKDHSIALIMHG